MMLVVEARLQELSRLDIRVRLLPRRKVHIGQGFQLPRLMARLGPLAMPPQFGGWLIIDRLVGRISFSSRRRSHDRIQLCVAGADPSQVVLTFHPVNTKHLELIA